MGGQLAGASALDLAKVSARAGGFAAQEVLAMLLQAHNGNDKLTLPMSMYASCRAHGRVYGFHCASSCTARKAHYGDRAQSHRFRYQIAGCKSGVADMPGQEKLQKLFE